MSIDSNIPMELSAIIGNDFLYLVHKAHANIQFNPSIIMQMDDMIDIKPTQRAGAFQTIMRNIKPVVDNEAIEL
ncbi:hypothetical protein AB6D11_02740 [Vibrio splendidus]